MDRLLKILTDNGAADAALISFSDCCVTNPRLASSLGFEPKSVCICTLPYYTRRCDEHKTVSAYALARDYHLLLKQIGNNVLNEAKKLFPSAGFAFFGDHSPINEKDAAAKAGLGIIGMHSLLITPRYSSFVFLFELLTDMECDAEPEQIQYCEKCGRCMRACPGNMLREFQCLSAITQKKGELSDEEECLISQLQTAWGCDICQMVCPHTVSAIRRGDIYTDNEWFNTNVIAVPDEDSINDKEDFKMRAYSWRGRNTILRNIKIINNSIDNKAKD